MKIIMGWGRGGHEDHNGWGGGGREDHIRD